MYSTKTCTLYTVQLNTLKPRLNKFGFDHQVYRKIVNKFQEVINIGA